MSAPDNAKLQANFKWERDGSMINVYATNQKEFEELLTTIQDTAALFLSVEQTLKGLARMNGSVVTSAPAAQSTPSAPSAPAASQNCSHGPMIPMSGVNARGPWSGLKCSAPQGTKPRCEPIYFKA